MRRTAVVLAAALLVAVPAADGAGSPEAGGYPWLSAAPSRTIAGAFEPPPGFRRVALAPGSYGAWLRHLPLAPAGTRVLNYDGTAKARQSSAAAVIDIDVGSRDLQQCADAVMRLRAEYLRAAGRRGALTFRFTSGDAYPYTRWLSGERPRVSGNKVSWVQGSPVADDRRQFRKWLDVIFAYAGTWSMVRDSEPVPKAAEVAVGDVLVQGGFPGHALTVVDLARDAAGAPAVLLAQSYMPAQSLHVVVNPEDPAGGAWYRLPEGFSIRTPDWPAPFASTDLRRLPGTLPES